MMCLIEIIAWGLAILGYYIVLSEHCRSGLLDSSVPSSGNGRIEQEVDQCPTNFAYGILIVAAAMHFAHCILAIFL